MKNQIKVFFKKYSSLTYLLLKSKKVIIFFSTIYLIAMATSMALMEILNYSWAFFAILYLFLNRKEIDFKLNFKEFLKSPELPIVLFVIWGFFVTTTSDQISGKLLHHLGPLRIFIIYFLARFTFRNLGELEIGYKVILFMASLGFIQALIQNYFRYDFIRGTKFSMNELRMSVRAQGFFNSSLTFSNSYLLFLLLGIMAVLFLWRGRKTFEKIFLIIFLIIGTLGLFYSGCRYLIYTLPFCIIVLVFLRNFKWSIICTLIFICFFGALSLSEGMRENFLEISNMKFKSNMYRLRLFKAYYELFKDYPVKGVGINNEGTIKKYLEKLYPDGQYLIGHAHNHFLNVLANTGIFGFLFFISFNMIWFIRFCFCYKRANDLFFRGVFAFGIVCLLAFHISGLTQDTYGDSEVVYSFFYMMGTLMMISKKNF